MKKQKQTRTGLIVGLSIAFIVVILIGGILLAGLHNGWFDDPKIVLSSEYYSESPKMIDLDAAGFEKLISEKKSFVIFVDQKGCTTADRLREYIKKYISEKKIDAYKMMFPEVKESSLHEYVKYYPSVVVVGNGKIRTYLRADSDDDVDEYNDYEVFKNWLEQTI